MTGITKAFLQDGVLEGFRAGENSSGAKVTSLFLGAKNSAKQRSNLFRRKTFMCNRIMTSKKVATVLGVQVPKSDMQVLFFRYPQA